MATNEGPQQPWEQHETVVENDFFTVTDERGIESVEVTSHNGGFAFTLHYDEWEQFVEAVRLLQTQALVETDICDAEEEEANGAPQWHFVIRYPEHGLSFYLVAEEWQALQAAVETAADYPWSPTLYRVDVAQMADKVAEQRRWVMARHQPRTAR